MNATTTSEEERSNNTRRGAIGIDAPFSSHHPLLAQTPKNGNGGCGNLAPSEPWYVQIAAKRHGGMKTQSADTSGDAERAQIALLRQAIALQRAQLVEDGLQRGVEPAVLGV